MIIEVLPSLQNSQQRGLLKVLQRMVIEPKYERKLFDTCIKIWGNINNNPSLRFQALKTMVDISKKYPDFLNEIILSTDTYYTENLSEGVKKSVLGEYGGLGYPINGHLWDSKMRNWGYGTYHSEKDLMLAYKSQFEQIIDIKNTKGLSAAVFTQITDVEGE